MSITSTTLLALMTLGAVALPIALVVMRRRAHPSWGRTLGSWLCIVMAQVLAVGAVGLKVNRDFGFYTSWDDLLGRQAGGPVAISTGGVDMSSAASGTVETFTISGRGAGNAQALAWLPPGYHDAKNAHRRYPVLVVLPGYANTVGATFENLEIGRTASALVDGKKVAPFIAVVAPYQTVQGRDTECTNIRKGAPEFDYLTRSVPNAIRTHLRTTPGTSQWSALGWSTGGYCAAKALYAGPSPWASAVSVDGYYEALTDETTGDLYPTKHDRIVNSPIELYRRFQMPSTRLLVVSSRADRDSIASSSRMTKLAKSDPHVASMWLPSGGHNYGTYVPYLPAMIQWAFSAPQV